MKKIIFILVLLLSFEVRAKYVQPEGVLDQADKNAGYQFDYMDTDKDGKLSLSEYKQKRLTRDVRRQIRKAKDEGRYMSPDEQFKKMDADGDGFITREDLSGFLRSYDQW